jgi:hypothetical protein
MEQLVGLAALGLLAGTFGTLINRVRGEWIIRGLALALGFVGLRILIMAL